MNERGFTLLEAAVVAGIISALAIAGLSSMGPHAAAARAGANQFDAAVAFARSVASSSGNGATMVVRQASITVMNGRPTSANALTAAGIPPFSIAATIAETAIGGAPFTIFFDSAGHASAMAGAVAIGDVVASDPGCPGGENNLTLTISDPRTSIARTLACEK
jgi:type II secretory pathway pseudopilin PulG